MSEVVAPTKDKKEAKILTKQQVFESIRYLNE